MEVSMRCLQGFSCVLCSEPHDSCHLQLTLNFYYSFKYCLKPRSLDSISLSGAPPAIAYICQLICLFRSDAPTESLYVQHLLSLSFQYPNRNFIFLSTHLSSLQTLHSKLYVSQFTFLFHSGAPIETLRLLTHLSLPFRCSNRNFTSLSSPFSFIQALQSKRYVF
jgi:hypothetical protein